jgi:hypothetical protein
MSHKEIKPNKSTERERIAFLYTMALEYGDLETVQSILDQAERDSVLERILLEVNDSLAHENDLVLPGEAMFADAARVQQIVRECLPSAEIDIEESESQLPALTIRHVLAQMQDDLTLKGQFRQEAAALEGRLQVQDIVLPSDLSQRSVHKFFKDLGLSAGERLQRLFRQAAIFLAMGREQHISRLAAARRERGKKKTRRRVQDKEASK